MGYDDDNKLLELIRKENDDAFATLYRKYQISLLNFAERYPPDSYSCEEVVQELFIQLHLRRVSLIIKTSVSSYLFKALRNRIFNYLRDKAVYRRHIGSSGSLTPVAQNNVEQFIDMKQLEGEIHFSLEQMPFKCREVYLLHSQGSFTLKKIAKLLNRPLDTTEKQFRKATALLRNDLKDI